MRRVKTLPGHSYLPQYRESFIPSAWDCFKCMFKDDRMVQDFIKLSIQVTYYRPTDEEAGLPKR